MGILIAESSSSSNVTLRRFNFISEFHRPWGPPLGASALHQEGMQFKIKRIEVKPGALAADAPPPQ
jgi:hypothetical protein